MKTNTFIKIVCLMSLLSNWASAQTLCKDQPYPYKYVKCDPAKPCEAIISNWCTTDPQSFSPGSGWSLVRRSPLSTFNYFISYGTIAQASAPTACIRLSTLEACANSAFQQWAEICSLSVEETNNPVEACALVTASANPNEISNPETNAAVTRIYVDCATGEILCDNPCPTPDPIHVKATHVFVNATENFKKLNAFDDACDGNCPDLKNRKTWNICGVIRHEIGHLFGLEDFTDDQIVNFGDCNYVFGLPGTLMHGNPLDITDPCEDLPLTDLDRCYFCKLYCSTEDCENHVLGVQQQFYDAELEWALFPNPSNGAFTLQFKQLLRPARAVAILDITGKLMKRISLQGQEFSGNLAIDSRELPTGSYIVRLETDKSFSQRLLKVIRE